MMNNPTTRSIRNHRIAIVFVIIFMRLLNSNTNIGCSLQPPESEIATRSVKDTNENPLAVRVLAPKTIPATIHFIHVSHDLYSNNSFPENVNRNIDDWRELHPKWEIKMWSNAEIRDELQDLMVLLSQITGPRSWVSNLVRYAILFRFGGIYLDTDIVPIQPLDPLLALSNFTVCETPYRMESTAPSKLADTIIGWDTCERACNAVIGATHKNEALRTVLRKSRVSTWTALKTGNTSYSLRLTGPPVWTRAAKLHGINVLHEKTFYPCHYRNTEACIKSNFLGQPNTFAMHQWAKSWQKSNRTNTTGAAVDRRVLL